ncbi:ribonuclease HII [Psychromicrobium silvestre]|uniref:Ribonuclease n=1 Tax=Psychromicrobium silvestre TaxID=1645614 RepID=A0A7Y9LS75_9MICC|nr:ribonuclease HII [Psychromicrobium silvestre]NYE94605.1 ribonuclease HII [Psychromicrobium silvestre]
MVAAAPTLAVERALMASGCRFVAGADEVGRGALAGPVSVGIVVVDASSQKPLAGVKDSKLLSAAEREALVPLIKQWAVGHAVGHAAADEIDALGLMAALRLAGTRAWNFLLGSGVRAEAVILDGNHDWLSAREQLDLFATSEDSEGGVDVPVHTKVKADLQCLSVAAASVLAKVERDALLVALDGDHPQFAWKVNKGYATTAHRAAIDQYGPSKWHRMSWRLGGTAGANAANGQVEG